MFSNSTYAQDITPPVTSYTLTPDTPDGDNGWYVTALQIDLKATDLESGVKKINYRIDGGTWLTVSYSNTGNLVQNPSFETAGATTTGIANWEATVVDPEGTYYQDITSAPAFPNNSARIDATGGTWHGINNQAAFIPAVSFDNMTASAWLKTQSAAGNAYFKIYAVSPDGSGGYTYNLLTQSPAITGSVGWTYISVPFVVTVPSAIGVYIDLGIEGPGSFWADAVTINSSLTSTETTINIASDNANHTVEFYSEDFDGNLETHSCDIPKSNCIEFKLDQTPPGNWNNSGAIRSTGGGSSSEHELWVFTNVEDLTSGLSVDTSEYQYHTENETGFGYYSNLLGCNSTWNADQLTSLEEYITVPGINTGYLKTQKTDFCDSNWKICKTVRFHAKDEAGNEITKDLCLNGPWIKVRGGGIVRSNNVIDMVAESNEYNTDGLIEVGGLSIDFFTSSQGWKEYMSPAPPNLTYEQLYNLVTTTKTQITDGDLVTTTGAYVVNGDLTIDNQSLPNNYDSGTFDQVWFIDGDLIIETDTVISVNSTALFVVSGNALIEKGVDRVGIAIIADGNIDTAYDINEGDITRTLDLNGLFIGENVVLQRTLQGTQNNDTPSESFVYEPKYLVQLKQFFNSSDTLWRYVQ